MSSLSSNKLKAWFFRIGDFSLINPALLAALKSRLPHFDWVEVDVEKEILGIIFKHHPLLYGSFLAEIGWRYGTHILKYRLPPRTFLPRLPRVLQAIQHWTQMHIPPASTAFTFQTQSLFDASHPEIPHFLYTDHTYLANQRYQNTCSISETTPTSSLSPLSSCNSALFFNSKNSKKRDCSSKPAFSPSLTRSRNPLLPVSPQWRNMEHTLYTRARVNFVSSHFAEESLQADYSIPASQIDCVYSGCNFPWPSQPRQHVGLGQRILFVGVDWERKGGPELLAAFQKLQYRLPAVELWIVGCSPFLGFNSKNQKALDLKYLEFQEPLKGVKVFGRIPIAEVQQLYQQADVFCLPSQVDPSASVLAEAASYDLPVVATAVGGNGERVIDGVTGFLCTGVRLQGALIKSSTASATTSSTNSLIDCLTERLESLLRHPELRQTFGDAGRQRVQNHFTWSAVAEKIALRMAVELNDNSSELWLADSQRPE